MRLTSSRAYTRPTAVPKMPTGLVELMEGLARDVLKSNPANVYEFCANHMEKLMEIRDGKSSKKTLTLEQKILIAQEKVRQKAKERQEKFDKEMQLQSDEITIVSDLTESPSTQTEPALPSLRAPVQHIHDLENASELEISHDSQSAIIPMSETSDPTINEESNVIKDDVTFDDVEESKENVNVQSVPEKTLKEKQIFGKIEEDTLKSDFLKESNSVEIIDHQVLIESNLQTISEASDENHISESKMILPQITINDDHDELAPANKLEPSLNEVQSDAINEPNNTNSNENHEMHVLESQHLLTVTELNLLSSEALEINLVPAENSDISANGEIIVSDSIPFNEHVSSNDKSNLLKIENEDPLNSGEPGPVLESLNALNVVSETDTEKYLNDSDVKETIQVDQNVDETTTLLVDTTVSSDSQNIKTQSADTSNVDNSCEDLKNELTVPDVSGDAIITGDATNIETQSAVMNVENTCDVLKNENTLYGLITESNVQINQTHVTCDDSATIIAMETTDTVTEAEKNNVTVANDENYNASEINSDTNIAIPELKSIRIDLNETQEKLEPSESGNHDSDFDRSHDNTTDVSLLKTDSIENTNDDSSIVESDLSKTDDDSTQNNPNNMDLETAAVAIQKVFRSFMFKNRNSTFDDANNDENNSLEDDNEKKEEYYAAAANLNKERRPLGITRMDTVLQTVNEEKSLSLSTDDSSTLSSAATTIQAHVRGFLVRNRLNSSKTFSMNSLPNSHEVLESDSDQQKSKTILNIHIVPEEGNYLSRDESLITSMDLSLDGSPPSSVNLHPLSYDISERRKMLKREDAVQSVSPPSNNSGKLSEDSVKEVLINENGVLEREPTDEKISEIEDHSYLDNEASEVISSTSTVTPTTVINLSKSEEPLKSPREYTEATLQRNDRSFTKMSSDESDVITPYIPSPRSEQTTTLVHSGEFHDVVLPTKVSRSDTSVVRGE